MARQPGEQASKQRRGKTAISSHPLFPVIVALWFGALFSLGSLAMRPSLLEQAMLAMHADLLIPAAAPPLGITARILIALAMAICGGLLGTLLARRIARPKTVARERQRGAVSVRARDAHPDAPARRPVSAHEEFGETGTSSFEAAPPVKANRRRSLAIEHDERTESIDAAPLPGSAPQIHDLTTFDVTRDAPPEEATGEAEAHEALDLGGFAAIAGQDGTLAADAPGTIAESTPEPAERAHVFAAPQRCAADEAAPTPAARFAPPSGEAAKRLLSAELGALSHVELIERLAISLQRRREMEVAAAPSPAFVEAAPRAAMPRIETAATALPNKAPQPAGGSSGLDDAIVPPPLAMPAALRPVGFDDHDHDNEDLSGLVPQRHISMPFQPAPVAETAREDEDLAETAANKTVALHHANGLEDEQSDSASDNDADALADGYSSLLDLGRPGPAKQQFIRIEEAEAEDAAIEPVVIFPGHAARTDAPFAAPAPFAQLVPESEGAAPLRRFDALSSATSSGQPISAAAAIAQDPEETAKSLRGALATLQRMSGAA